MQALQYYLLICCLPFAVFAQTTIVTLKAVQPTETTAVSVDVTSLVMNPVGTGVGPDGARTYSWVEIITKQVVPIGTRTTITNTDIQTVSGVLAIGESVYRYATTIAESGRPGLGIQENCSLGPSIGSCEREVWEVGLSATATRTRTLVGPVVPFATLTLGSTNPPPNGAISNHGNAKHVISLLVLLVFWLA
ncbi:hypothetical protein HGRIS_008965 [Hohenbuehelia grisea]|uniref:Uncharacterized protein n=1 Tax=Hohenbuehelia grisea TaxID=104357 RepID=A0ABR3IZP7_9AGAR